jgi:hypothetical protein
LPGVIGLPPQLLVWLKLVGLVPLLLITDTVRLVVPELVTVTGSVLVVPTSVDGKLSAVVESVAVGALPFPLNVTVCGDPVALSLIFNVAE